MMESTSIKLEPPSWDDGCSTSVGNNKTETKSEMEANSKWQSASDTSCSVEAEMSSSGMDTDSETVAADFRWQPLTGTSYSYVKFPYRQNIQQARLPDEVDSKSSLGTGLAADNCCKVEQAGQSQDNNHVDKLICPSEIKQEPSSEDDKQEPPSEDDDIESDDDARVKRMKAPPSKSPATFTVRLIKSEPLDGNDDPGKTAVQPATEVEGNKSVSLSEDTAKIGLWSGTAGFFPHMYGTPSTSNHSFGVALATLRKTVDQLPGSEKPTNMYYTQPSRTAPKGPTEERPYACEQCQAAFTQAVYLKKHLKTHSGIKPWKCEQCGKTFIRRSQLSVHARSHSGEKPYKCSHCDATFAQSGHLQVHTRTHTGEKPFHCEQCDATFTTSSQKRTHVRSVHSNHRPFECLVCGMTFSSPANLRVHCRTHSGEKPYKCDKCDAAFTQSSNLKQHLLRHTGSTPFACQFCGAKFARLGPLQRHYEVHSEQETPFLCLECDAAFSKLSSLQSHVKKAHGTEKTYSCEICSATFSQSWNLKRHKLTHSGMKPFQCFQCDSAFSQPSHLKQHLIRIHGEKPQPFDLMDNDRVLSGITAFPDSSIYKGSDVSSGKPISTHTNNTDGSRDATSYARSANDLGDAVSHVDKTDGAMDTTSHADTQNISGTRDAMSHAHYTEGAMTHAQNTDDAMEMDVTSHTRSTVCATSHADSTDSTIDTTSHAHSANCTVDTTSCTHNADGARNSASHTHNAGDSTETTDEKGSHCAGEDVKYPVAEQDKVHSDTEMTSYQ